MSTEFEARAMTIVGEAKYQAARDGSYTEEQTELAVADLTAASQADQVALLERLMADADGTMTDQCWIAMRKRAEVELAALRKGAK